MLKFLPGTVQTEQATTRTTLVGSMMPLEIRLTYSPVWESKPQEVLIRFEDLADDHRAVLARVDRDLAGRI